MMKPRLSKGTKKLAHNAVAIVTALSLVFLQTPVSYAAPQDDGDAVVAAQAESSSAAAKDTGEKDSAAKETKSSSAEKESKSEGAKEQPKAEEPAAPAEETPSEPVPAEDEVASEAAAEEGEAVAGEEGELIDETELTEEELAESESTEEEEAEKPDTKRVYEYKDAAVKVTATLDDPTAIPDKAELVVTAVTPTVEGYNYNAYMEALNKDAGKKDAFTQDNTLLYDVAFLATDEDGKTVELQPAVGSVKVKFEFLQNQLSGDLNAAEAEDVELTHLPLKASVRDSVDTTAQATDIKASDVVVEALDANLAMGNTERATFVLDDLSIIAASTHPDIFGQPDQTNSQVNFSRALGRAVEYGIVADTYHQANHQQTNFAVKTYNNTSDNGEPDLAGTHTVPYQIGSFATGSKKLRFGSSTYQSQPVQYDVYLPQSYEADINNYVTLDGGKATLNTIYEDADTIKNNVTSMIGSANTKSQELASHATTIDIKNSYTTDQNELVIDTTSYDDDAVIYINVPNTSDYANLRTYMQQNQSYLHLHKKPGQVIVFNVLGSSPVTLKKMIVTLPSDPAGAKTSKDDKYSSYSPNGQNAAVNERIDEQIAQKVIWNFPEASSVTLDTAAGVFLVPNGSVDVIGTSAGWIVSGGTVTTTGCEFHFLYRDRHYTPQSVESRNLSFKAYKGIKDASGKSLGLGGKTFGFNLYETGSTFSTEGRQPIETVNNNAQSDIIFSAITYTKEMIDSHEGGVFYYVIKEANAGETQNGVTNWDGQINIKLIASVVDDNIQFRLEYWRYQSNEDMVQGNPDNVPSERDVSGQEYTFSTVYNRYDATTSIDLGAKKTLDGQAPTAGQFKFELTEVADAEGTPIVPAGGETVYTDTATNDDAGKVSFKKINYSASDASAAGKKHYYKITEKNSGSPAINYSNASHVVTVTVTDDGKGNLTAVADKKAEDVSFANTTKTVDVAGSKTWNDDNNADKRPESVEVKLQSKVGESAWADVPNRTKTLSGTDMSYEFKGLPEYNGADKIQYRVVESTVPAGYVATGGDANSEYNLTNTITKVKVSKNDIAGSEELEGATIQILNDNNEVVAEWVSSKDDESTTDVNEGIHEITGLAVGTYTLKETVAPEGYTITTDTTFTIDENGNVTATGSDVEDGVILVKDTKTKVTVSKTDLTGENELEGARIQVIKVVDGKEEVVEEWDSTAEDHVIEGLATGVEYTLRETVAPNGYAIASDTKFTIDENGTVKVGGTAVKDGKILVKDAETVKVSKTDATGQTELAGARIEVYDSNNQKVDEWTSEVGSPHAVEGVRVGEEYTLKETVAPDGYTIATETTFSIDSEGIVTTTANTNNDGVLLIEDNLTKVTVSKVEIGGSDELPGATIQILKDGQVVKLNGEDLQWVSMEEPHVVEGLKTGVTYTLHEEVAPDGYTVATDTTFTIDENGKVVVGGSEVEGGVLLIEDAKTRVKVSKVEIGGSDEIAGAKIQILDKDGNVVKINNEPVQWTSEEGVTHIIEGLTAGVTYTLHEEVAPDGYAVATDTTFTIDSKTGKVTTSGKQAQDGTLLIEDAKTKVKVSKVDATNNEELAGAHIQIIDKDGNVKAEWTSDKDNEETTEINEAIHEVEGLAAGAYTLKETVAPDGYTITSDTPFTIDKFGKVTVGGDGTITEDGVILIKDELALVQVSKVVAGAGEELPGAHIQVIDSNGDVVDEWVSGEKPHGVSGVKAGETYTLKETVAPDGYTIAAETTFTINDDGTVTSQGTKVKGNVVLLEDSLTKVKVSKVDATGGQEVAGAHIQILDKDGNVKDEWDSTTTAHEVEGLTTGETYTLRETVAPDGYAVTTDTTFELNADGTVNKDETTTTQRDSDGALLVEDDQTVVKVSKVDIADSEEVAGATIQIIKIVEGNETVVKEWESGTEAHVIKGLSTETEYILRETVAPDGYTITTDTTFTIDKNGKVTTSGTQAQDGTLLIQDAKTKVRISKVDVANSEEIAGATIQILKDGKVVKLNGEDLQWVSTDKPHVVVGLTTGVEYTLHETVAPAGYTIAADTTFTIDENGNVTSSGSTTQDGVLLVEDAQTVVNISKVDIGDSKEVAGAHIQILKGNDVVTEWDSTTEAHEVKGLETDVEYTLRETVAPDGYTVTTDTAFTIDTTGKVTSSGTINKDGVLLVEDSKTKVKVSKTDIASSEELPGAKIQILDEEGNVVEIDGDKVEWTSGDQPHEIVGLKTGVEYTLRETVAPDGYAIATDTTFTIDEKGKVTTNGTQSADGTLLVEDAKTVTVSKVDIANSEEVTGAHIQVLDKDDNIIDEWDSEAGKPHAVKGVKVGETYTLKETVAPDGYTVTTDTTFTIDTTGKVTSSGTINKDGVLLVEDSKTKVKISKVDVVHGFELEGAHIQIIGHDAEGNEVVVEEWDSTEEAHVIEGLKTQTEYILRETVAPDGYTIASDTTFTIDEKGKVTGSVTVTEDGVLLVEDKLNEVSVTKVDADGNPLNGAKMQILNAKGEEVAHWTSGRDGDVFTTHHFTVGETYTLREAKSPAGYKVAADQTFTVDAQGNVTFSGETKDGVLIVKDEKTSLKVSKTDITGDNELPGATIQILDVEKNVVELGGEKVEWVSGEEPHEIVGLNVGEKYYLKETVAPDGYAIASLVPFQLNNDGTVHQDEDDPFIDLKEGVLLLKDDLTRFTVKKTDLGTGEEIPGAKIQILDENDNVVMLNDQPVEWTSDGKPHVVEGLTAGKTYKLHEEVAPDGYTIASDTTFKINEKGKVFAGETEVANGELLIKDSKTKVSISKVDVAGGKEIGGATIQILNSKNEVVEEWTSEEGKTHVVEGLKTGETYTLKETVAPDGYTIATETKFELNADGTINKDKTTTKQNDDGVLLVEDAKTKVKVSKVEIGGSEEIAGATIQIIKTVDGEEKVVEEWTSGTEAHEIEGLETETEYILRETVAPDGYAITTDTTFTIAKDGNVTTTGTQAEDGTLLVEDAKTVTVSKVETGSGKEIDGAHIVVLDKDGKTVDEWDSKAGENHAVKNVKVGETYTLRETVAPKGYDITTDTTFKIKEDGTVETTAHTNNDGVLLVEDAPLTTGDFIITKTVGNSPVTVEELESGAITFEVKVTLPDGSVKYLDADGKLHTDVVELTLGPDDGFVLSEDEMVWTKTFKNAPAGEYEVTETNTAIEGYEFNKDDSVTNGSGTLEAGGETTVDLKNEYDIPGGGGDTPDTPYSPVDMHGTVKVSVNKCETGSSTFVPGAQLQLISKASTNVIAEWTTTEGTHEVGLKLTVGDSYTLHEVSAPTGYEKAADVDFTISEENEVVEITSGQKKSGADNATSDENTITLYDAKEQKEEKPGGPTDKPEYATVTVAKYATGTTTFVNGATLAVVDKKTGKTVDTWTTTGAAHTVAKKLEVGKSYILKETKTPTGYTKAADVEFKVKDTKTIMLVSGAKTSAGKVNASCSGTNVNLYDAKSTTAATTSKSTSGSSNPQTGDYTGMLAGILATISAAAIGLFEFARRRRQAEEA